MTAPKGMKPADTLIWSGALDRALASLGGEGSGDGGLASETAAAPSPDETIIGSDASEEIQGGNGNDIVMGGGGDDTIWGGYRYKPYELDGDDYLNGGAGNDWIIGGGGDDLVFGGAGNDRLSAGLGNNILNGGDGDDNIDTAGYEEWGNDIVFGGAGDDVIRGYGDILDGGSGNDRIYDAYPHSVWQNPIVRDTTIRGGDGDDEIAVRHLGTVDGGNGYDRLDIDLQNVWMEIDFDGERGTINTGLTFTNFEEFNIQGQLLADNIRGAAGNDTLTGDNNDDLLDGRGGDDVLHGGNYSDRLIGGEGADTFLWDYETPPNDPNDPWEYAPTIFADERIDHIADFNTEDGDVLRFSYTAKNAIGMDSYEEFMAAATDTPEGVFIAFDGTGTRGVLLEGVARSDLLQDDFAL